MAARKRDEGRDRICIVTYVGGTMTNEEEIKAIIADHLGVRIEEITPEASLTFDLGADSLDTVELVMAMEEKFGISVSDEDASKIETVADAIKHIERIIGEQK